MMVLAYLLGAVGGMGLAHEPARLDNGWLWVAVGMVAASMTMMRQEGRR